MIPPKKIYRPKVKEEETQKRPADPERTTSNDVIQIGCTSIEIQNDDGKPIVIDGRTSADKAKGDAPVNKNFLPRWCPLGLTHTQRRKLQRLRQRELKEQEKEKQRDEQFNRYRPMIP